MDGTDETTPLIGSDKPSLLVSERNTESHKNFLAFWLACDTVIQLVFLSMLLLGRFDMIKSCDFVTIVALLDIFMSLLAAYFSYICLYFDFVDLSRDSLSLSFLYTVLRIYVSMYCPELFRISDFHQIYLILTGFLACLQATAIKHFHDSTLDGKLKKNVLQFPIIRERNAGDTSSDSTAIGDKSHQKQGNVTSNTACNGKPRSSKPKIEGLEAMRFFAALHIVIIHYYADPAHLGERAEMGATPADALWANFQSWGRSQLTLFFMLSGFVLAYVNADKVNKLETYAFWSRRFSRLYPMFLLSVVGSLCLVPRDQYDGPTLAVVLFGLEAWVPWAYLNAINTPAWSIGVFVLLYLIFPSALRIITGTNKSTRDLLLFLMWLFATTALAATYQSGKDLGGALGPLYKWVFVAHVSEFLMGVTLGYLFLLHPPATVTRNPVGRFLVKIGATLSIVIINYIYVTSDHRKQTAFWWWWGANGLLAPLYGLMIWCNAFNQDLVVSGVFSSRLFVYLGSLSFQIYIFQAFSQKFACYLQAQCNYTMLVSWAVAVVMRPLEDHVSAAFLQIVEAPSRLACWKTLKTWWLTIDVYAFSPTVKGLWYYAVMAFVIVGYTYVNAKRLWGLNSFTKNDDPTTWDGNVNFDTTGMFDLLDWSALLGAPAAALALLGHLRSCPWSHMSRSADLTEEISMKKFRSMMFFRIVTKGSNPTLVRDNVMEAVRVLSVVLPSSAYAVEVVTDTPIGAQLHALVHTDEGQSMPRLVEVVVPADYGCPTGVEILTPDDYACPTGAKFKARALQYALENTLARDSDWVVHLDEETRVDEQTVRQCVRHCESQDLQVAQCKKMFGDIGIGCILYGADTKSIGSYVCALADSVRVGDHLGRYRLLSALGRPWAGLQGSFVVCQQGLERTVSFDHGRGCSNAEFSAFGLMASRMGVGVAWVPGYMYEQSPYFKWDLVMQRRHWFRNLMGICIAPSSLALSDRVLLAVFTLTWALAPVPLLVTATKFVVNLPLPDAGTTTSNIVLAAVTSVHVWTYVLGFLTTFDVHEGPVRFLVLLGLLLMLLPIFALMEAAGVLLAVLLPFADTYYTVRKER